MIFYTQLLSVLKIKSKISNFFVIIVIASRRFGYKFSTNCNYNRHCIHKISGHTARYDRYILYLLLKNFKIKLLQRSRPR